MYNPFKSKINREKSSFVDRLANLFRASQVDNDFYDQLEEILIGGDVGVQTSLQLVEEIRREAAEKRIEKSDEIKILLRDRLAKIFKAEQENYLINDKPHLILLVGVNGSGKTTSAAKLAHYYKEQGKKILLVAGDTFRAAAIEQLEVWANRAGVDLIRQQPGSDPSALYFDAINSARAKNIDLIIGDTAGRLHNKDNLMDELNKIYRVINRNLPGAPHQTLLVVDATTGHNALAQAKSFNETLPVSGIILTKLDGTARGGIVIAIQNELKIPVIFTDLGEGIEELALFDPLTFIDALLDQ